MIKTYASNVIITQYKLISNNIAVELQAALHVIELLIHTFMISSFHISPLQNQWFFKLELPYSVLTRC